MRKHLADGIDVGAIGYQQCSVGMAESVEGDFLLDSGIFEPFLEWFTRMCSTQSFEYHAAAGLAAIRQGFVAQRQCCLRLGLLGADPHTVAAVGGHFDVLPTELQNIADAETGHTGEQRCPFQHIHFAGSGSETFDLFYFEVVDFGFLPVDAVKIVIDILTELAFLIRQFK